MDCKDNTNLSTPRDLFDLFSPESYFEIEVDLYVLLHILRFEDVEPLDDERSQLQSKFIELQVSMPTLSECCNAFLNSIAFCF